MFYIQVVTNGVLKGYVQGAGGPNEEACCSFPSEACCSSPSETCSNLSSKAYCSLNEETCYNFLS